MVYKSSFCVILGVCKAAVRLLAAMIMFSLLLSTGLSQILG